MQSRSAALSGEKAGLHFPFVLKRILGSMKRLRTNCL